MKRGKNNHRRKIQIIDSNNNADSCNNINILSNNKFDNLIFSKDKAPYDLIDALIQISVVFNCKTKILSRESDLVLFV